LPAPQTFWTSGALHEARALIWPRRYRFFLGLVLLLINRLTSLVLPVSMMYFVDRVISARRTEVLPFVALAIGVGAIVQASTTFALAKLLELTSQQSIAQLRRKIQAHVMRLPIRYFDTAKSGDIVSRVMADTEHVRELIGGGIVHFGGSALTSVAALAYLFYLNASLTAALLAAVALFGAAIAWLLRRQRPFSRDSAEIRGRLYARLNETLGGIRVVKTYTAEGHEARLFTTGVHGLFRNLAASHLWWSANVALTTLAIGAIGIVITVIGGPAVLSGGMTLGKFLSYIMSLTLVFGPLEHVMWMGPRVTEAMAALDRVHALLATDSELAGDEHRAPLGQVAGEVRFENVSFEYNPGIPALRSVTFDAPAGTTVALVGASGAGKSTLINLLMAFARPTAGKILVDGRDLTSLRLYDYRAQLGVVLQDNFLFDGTIAENIRYGASGAGDDEVRAAGRVAHTDEFVRRMPLAYDTVVGERGVKLSGGQRQRVAIARAILANPRILVLDEATSSLDSETEALIQDGLRTLRRGRTTFVIAHRLSTVRSADLILVLDAGRIIERGTHSELLARGGAYRAFYDRQYARDSDQFTNTGEEQSPP
jgi:subfamily B ATP-binding cassette protein MsbA